MKQYDPRVESKGHHICHVVGENEGVVLGDKSRHDVFETVRAVAEYWKADSDKLRHDNHAKRWNELTQWLRRNPDATVEQVIVIMSMLNDEDIRNGSIRVRDFKF